MHDIINVFINPVRYRVKCYSNVICPFDVVYSAYYMLNRYP